MLIVSKIQREGGSRITVGGATYVFEPTGPDGEHMCEIEDTGHIKRLLSIPEGFEPYDPTEAKGLMPKPKPRPSPEQALEEAIEPAADLPQAEAGDPDPESELEVAIEADVDDGLEELTDLDLSHAYKDEFDKAPTPNMKRATMINRIRKARSSKE